MAQHYSIAIIGSGPAGFYAAEHLLASHSPILSVDMYDRLPTPWGLVRAGVAPDHPRIKSVSSQFETIASHPRYRFFGNIEFGKDIPREAFLCRYDAVLYAVGARSERCLDIDGEKLPGSLAASDFVGWYNGHPEFAKLAPDLTGKRAVVIGNGNVALDVARMLLLPHSRLRQTDMADHAITALSRSNIRDVTIIGRRGPTETNFTTAELRELENIDGLNIGLDDASSYESCLSANASDDRQILRNLEVFRRFRMSNEKGERRLRFRFLRSPIEIFGVQKVEGLTLSINRLQGSNSAVRAVDTGQREILPADLIIRAVGYRGLPLPDVPFDSDTATILNKRGKVDGAQREYVAGWIKRGPSGIIGTNRADAIETVDHLISNLTAPSIAASHESIDAWLRDFHLDVVDQTGWLEIDRQEKMRGREQGRPRVKFTTIAAMLTASRSMPEIDSA